MGYLRGIRDGAARADSGERVNSMLTWASAQGPALKTEVKQETVPLPIPTMGIYRSNVLYPLPKGYASGRQANTRTTVELPVTTLPPPPQPEEAMRSSQPSPSMPQKVMDHLKPPQSSPMASLPSSDSVASLVSMVSSGSNDSLSSMGTSSSTGNISGTASPTTFQLGNFKCMSVKEEGALPASLDAIFGATPQVRRFGGAVERPIAPTAVIRAHQVLGRSRPAVTTMRSPEPTDADVVPNRTKSCQGCVKDKKKCDGGRPCCRCSKKGRVCVEPPKTRKRKINRHFCWDCFHNKRPKYNFPSISNLRRHQRESCVYNPTRKARRNWMNGVAPANAQIVSGLDAPMFSQAPSAQPLPLIPLSTSQAQGGLNGIVHSFMWDN